MTKSLGSIKSIVLLVIALPGCSCLSAEIRRSVLLPWRADTRSSMVETEGLADTENVIGYAEERRDAATRTLEVKIGWNLEGEADETFIRLPYIENPDSLASTQWPGGIAAAILCLSPTVKQFLQSKAVMELGCGLALAGLTASQSSGKTWLTDNDELIVRALQETIGLHYTKSESTIDVAQLDWRDKKTVTEKFPCIISADVAYYYFLLRPLMDTMRSYLLETNSFLLSVGQANRESQWDLHKNLLNGCYNQLTDQHEAAWPGSTQTLLYRLQMSDWEPAHSANLAGIVDGTIPIAALLYQTEGLQLSPLSKWDHVATKDDIEQMETSF